MTCKKLSKLTDKKISNLVLGQYIADDSFVVDSFGNGEVFVDDEGWTHELLAVYTQDGSVVGYVLGEIAPEAADYVHGVAVKSELADLIATEKDWKRVEAVARGI